jgi:hypothetical protein
VRPAKLATSLCSSGTVSDAVPSGLPGPVSSPSTSALAACTFEVGVDFYGGDLGSADGFSDGSEFSGLASAAECCAKCQAASPACGAWTFGTGGSNAGKCWLKKASGFTRKSNVDRTSGSSQSGGLVPCHNVVSDAAACCNQCAATAGCEGYYAEGPYDCSPFVDASTGQRFGDAVTVCHLQAGLAMPVGRPYFAETAGNYGSCSAKTLWG